MNPSELVSDPEAWYVLKQDNGQCTIASASEVETRAQLDESTKREYWGPYDSQQAAIARRVGLIRAGKCQPV